jgi:hypothetical protein
LFVDSDTAIDDSIKTDGAVQVFLKTSDCPKEQETEGVYFGGVNLTIYNIPEYLGRAQLHILRGKRRVGGRIEDFSEPVAVADNTKSVSRDPLRMARETSGDHIRNTLKIAIILFLVGLLIFTIWFFAGASIKTTLGLPVSYSEVIGSYPSGTKLCNVEGQIVSGFSENDWQIILSGKVEAIDNQIQYPCYGTKVTSEVPIQVNGKRYPAGTKLTVDGNLEWVVVTDGNRGLSSSAPTVFVCEYGSPREDLITSLKQAGAIIVYERIGGAPCVDELFGIYPNGNIFGDNSKIKIEKQVAPTDVEILLSEINDAGWFTDEVFDTWHSPCAACSAYYVMVSYKGKEKIVKAVDGGTDASSTYWQVISLITKLIPEFSK